jgi:hypothetical protein
MCADRLGLLTCSRQHDFNQYCSNGDRSPALRSCVSTAVFREPFAIPVGASTPSSHAVAAGAAMAQVRRARGNDRIPACKAQRLPHVRYYGSRLTAHIQRADISVSAQHPAKPLQCLAAAKPCEAGPRHSPAAAFFFASRSFLISASGLRFRPRPIRLRARAGSS